MKRLSQIAKEGKIDEDASLTDRQSIIINAPIDEVWQYLIDVEKWPNWNTDIQWVKMDSNSEGGQFTWNVNGKNIQSKIENASKPNTLSWVGKSGWVKSIFLWTLDEIDENQTVVSVEESLQGFMLFLFMNHQKLHSNLLHWLDCLKEVADPESTLI